MAATVAVQPVGYNHHHPVDNVPSLTSLRTALAMASITMSTAPPLTKNNADGNQQDGHRSSLQRADSGATSSSKSSGTSESLDDSTAETAPDHENEEDSPAPSYILPAVATATFPPAPSSSSSSSRPPSLKANAWRLEFRGVVKWVRWSSSSPSSDSRPSSSESGSTMPRLGCLGALRDPRSKNSVPRAKSSKSKNQVSLIDALRLPDATPATMQSSLPEIPSSVNRVRAAHPYSDSPTSMPQTLHHPPGFLDAHQAQPTILIHHSEPSVLTLHNSRNVARNSDQDQTFWPDDVTEADLDQEAARAEIETRKARRRKGLSLNSRINEQPDLSEPSTSFDTQRHNLLVTSLTSGTDQHTFSPASPAPSSSQDNHLTTRSDITHSTQQPAFLTPPPSNFDHSNASPIASPIQDETEPRNPPSRAKTSVSRRISLSVKDRLRRSFSLHNTFTPVTPPPPVPSRNPDSVDPPSMHETFSNIVSVKHSASTGMDHKLLNKSRRSGSLSGLSLRSIHQHDSENRVESPQNGENGRISKASTASGTGLAKLSRAMSLSVPASLRISTKHLYSHKDVPSGASTEPLPPLPPIPAISPIEKHFRDSLQREPSKKEKQHRRKRSRTKSQPSLPSPSILQAVAGDNTSDYVSIVGVGSTMTDETIGKGKGAISLPASAFASTVTLPGNLQPYYVSPASSIPPVPALPSDLVGLAPNPNAPRRKLTKKRKSHSAQNSVDLTHNPLPSSSISRDNSNSSSLPPSTWKEFGVMDRSNSGSSSGSVSKLRKKRGGSIGNLKESISTEEKIIPEPPSNSMPSTPNGTLNGTFDGERKRKHRSKLSSIDTTNGSFAESSPSSSTQKMPPLSALVYTGHHGYYEREILRAEMEKKLLEKTPSSQEDERGRSMQLVTDRLSGSALSTSPEVSPALVLSPSSSPSVELRTPSSRNEDSSVSPEPSSQGSKTARERSASRRRGDQSSASIAVPLAPLEPSASTTKFVTSPSSPNFVIPQVQGGVRRSIYEEFPPSGLPMPVLTAEPEPLAPLGGPANNSSGSSESRVDLVQFLNLPQPSRPQLAHRPTSNAARRWTMAMSDIPDDAEFLKEIEDLNRSNGVSRSNSNRSDAGSGYDDELLEEDENIDDGEDQIVWMTVRRAALCIREILRTEISYRDHMTRLFQAETTNPTAPNALLAHLPALISASKTLAGRFEEDPSVCGVSAAFLSTENELEQAMVSWSKVVGEVMIEFAKSNLVASESVPKRSESNKSVVSRVRIRPRPASMDPAVNDSQRNGRLNVFGAGRSKDLTAQDIAIMPTQRAPRYVMHFRDLLHHTPATSPSRALVERALEAAIRLARNCNQAQEHTSLIAGVQRSS